MPLFVGFKGWVFFGEPGFPWQKGAFFSRVDMMQHLSKELVCGVGGSPCGFLEPSNRVFRRPIFRWVMGNPQMDVGLDVRGFQSKQTTTRAP